MNTSPYPVRVDAQLDSHLSRWLWLFKWILAIPHYVVLLFLWIAFVVLSVVAFFAILFTGRYPRSLFDFNVGVLRWTWRVNYYAYGALGTDHYPPFTLDDRPDYPAHFEVEYPDHLSRGLVLVKWWLLAIPHYLLVGLFLSGAAYVYDAAPDDPRISFGLISVLVLIAAVTLLFTGRYPGSVYDLVLGLNRWVLRVAAYVGLMTDVYPPFRLDQGGADPARLVARDTGTAASATETTPAAPAPHAVTPASPTPSAPRWTAGRVIALVLGCLLLAGAVGSGLSAGAVAVARGARDSDGYLMSPTQTMSTDSYALITESAEIQTDPGTEWLPGELLGDANVTATGTEAVFLGIARTADVRGFLGETAHATISDLDTDGPEYTTSGTGAPTNPPGAVDIWVAQAAGAGTQQLVWPVEEGDWTLVVMNANASAGVETELAVGATVPALDWLLPALLVVTGVLLLLAIPCFVVALRPRHER